MPRPPRPRASRTEAARPEGPSGDRRRAVGLDAGPMSGFNNSRIDELFFAGTRWKSNFLVNLGYGDAEGLFPRSPRLSFEEATRFE